MIKNIKTPQISTKTDLEALLRADPRFKKVKTYQDARTVLSKLKEASDKKRPFWYRVKSFILGTSKLGREAGMIIDFITMFVPYGKHITTGRALLRTILKRKQQKQQMDKPMLKKILSLKNFINVKDNQGNLNFQEVISSVIQLAIATAFVWAATTLGLWEQLSQFLELN